MFNAVKTRQYRCRVNEKGDLVWACKTEEAVFELTLTALQKIKVYFRTGLFHLISSRIKMKMSSKRLKRGSRKQIESGTEY